MNRIGSIVAIALLALPGCSLLKSTNTSGSVANEAIKYANMAVAVVQCSQDAVKVADPEAGVQACIVHWVPNAPAVLADPVWPSTASCIRTWVTGINQPSSTITKEQRVQALASAVTQCLAQNMSAIVAAAQAQLASK